MRPAGFTFALVAALLALGAQWCAPLAHALHASAEMVVAAGADHDEQAHHHHADGSHDDGEEPGQPAHDESTCHTCQQFLAARAMALPAMSVMLVALAGDDAGAATLYDTPYVSRTALTLTVPRGPPAA